jgi:hypothetical protein
MATDAPLVVAQVVSPTLQTPPHNGDGRDLRNVFFSEDASALWSEIYLFVQATGTPLSSNCETITQDLFLHLLSLKKNDGFLAKNCTNEELRLELCACLQEMEHNSL